MNSLLILFISSISFALFEMVSSENHQYTVKLSQPLTKNKTKKRRIVLKCYLTAAHKNREAILMAFSDMQISKTGELKITCMHNSRQYIQYIQRNLTFCINMNLMNRPNRHWTVARYPVAESSLISNFQQRCPRADFLISGKYKESARDSARDSARTIRAQSHLRGADYSWYPVGYTPKKNF